MTKREHILAAAQELFVANGFEKTPTSAISKAAGVATGTLFHHFKTKEDLISTLYFELKMELRDRVFSKLTGAESLQDILFSTASGMIEWSLDSPSKFHFMVQFGESSLIPSSTRERVEEAFEGINDLLHRGITEGVFYDLPEDLMKRQLSAHLFAGIGFLIEKPELWQSEEFRASWLDSFWRVMAKE